MNEQVSAKEGKSVVSCFVGEKCDLDKEELSS